MHAVEDIKQGDEITTPYMDCIGMPRAERQSYLRELFRFDCHCRLCDLPSEAERAASDARLTILGKKRPTDLVPRPPPGSGGCEYRWKLRCVCMTMRLLRDEGIRNTHVACCLCDAFLIAVNYGDIVRAQIFAQRSLKERIALEGEDSPNVAVLRPYVAKPEQHRMYGMLAKKCDEDKEGNEVFPLPKDIKELNDGSPESEVWLWMDKECFQLGEAC